MVFFRYLTACIARHLPDFGHQALSLLGDGAEGHQRLFVIAFVKELSRQEIPLLLVLDDYHEITSPFVHQFLEDLLLHLPKHVHVMIASRITPPFNFYRLRDVAGLQTIATENLRFSDKEVQRLRPADIPGLTPAAWEALTRKLHGWPVAVRFAVDACRSGATVMGLDNGDTDFYNYLATEVLSRQPTAMIDFIQRIAVLDIITPDACNKLLGRKDADLLLDTLNKQNLFIHRLEEPETAYRYHQLFREFLLKRLGNSRRHWQRQAGIIARDRGDLSTAMECFRASGADQDLLAILKDAARQAFRQGRWQTVIRWLKTVAAEDLSADPWLGLCRAKHEIYQGRLDEAEKWLNGAIPLFASAGDHSGLTESRLLQARILRCRGHFAESIELLEQVLLQLPSSEKFRVDLPLEKFSCLLYTGHFSEAEAVLTKAMALSHQTNDNYATAHLLEGLGHVYWMQCDYPRALQMYQKSAEHLPDWFLPSYHMQDYIAFIYLDWGEWEQALNYAKRNAAIKESLGLADALPSTYGQLASIYLSLGEWALAEEYCKRAIDFVRKNNGDRIYSALNLAIWAECLGLQNRWLEAQAKAVEALAEVGPYSVLSENVCQVLGSLSFIHTGDLRRGKELLSMAIKGFDQTGFKRGQYYGYAFHAWLSIIEGDPAIARTYTEKALTLGAKHNLLNLFLTHYHMLQPVLQLGLENEVEVTFIQRILARKGEQAMPLLTHLAKHADPEVRLRTIAPSAEIRGPQAAGIIAELIKDADTAVRRPAILAAQRLGLETPGAALPAPATVSLQVRMLGSFQVFAHGQELGKSGWRTAKTQDLLAYLLHRREPVARDRLQEDLWPDLDPENAGNIFHVTLHRLRKILGKAGCPDILCYRDKRYSLRLESFRSDMQQFQELATAGLDRNGTPDERADCLEQAAALYRGDYLKEMDYPWLFHCREKLKHLHVDIRLSLARHYLQIRSYSRSLTHLHVAEEADPFSEETHALLMQAYAGQGSRPAAVRQYRKAEEIFKRELGLQPSLQLRALYGKLVK